MVTLTFELLNDSDSCEGSGAPGSLCNYPDSLAIANKYEGRLKDALMNKDGYKLVR